MRTVVPAWSRGPVRYSSQVSLRPIAADALAPSVRRGTCQAHTIIDFVEIPLETGWTLVTLAGRRGSEVELSSVGRSANVTRNVL